MKCREFAGFVGLMLALMLVNLPAVAQRLFTEPIYISGIEDMLSRGLVNEGSGTNDDPYVIKQFVIAGDVADYGLVIENVHSHVVIQDCEITSVLAPQAQGGIVLRGCSHITIRDCYIHHNTLGIHLSHCSNVTIESNYISANDVGIRIDFLSQGNRIISNYFQNRINAWACCTNTWDDGKTGNFWSDLTTGEDSYPHRYVISSGNHDLLARSSEDWPCRKDNSTTPNKLDSPPVFEDGQGKSDDVTPPVLDLKGEAELYLGVGDRFQEPGWVAMDSEDGDLSDKVERKGQVDASVPGEYQLTYVVADSGGNRVTAIRRVIVCDKTAPEIAILGSDPLLLSIEDRFQDPGAIARDNYDRDISHLISSSIPTDLAQGTPGVYTVRYSVTDKVGNSISAERSVVLGWPDPVSYGGIRATLERLDITTDPVSASIAVRYDDILAPHDLQLRLAFIAHSVAACIARLTKETAVSFAISDKDGPLAEFIMPMTGSLPYKDGACAAISSLRSVNDCRFRDGEWHDFAGAPTTQQQAKALLEHAFSLSELSNTPIDTRVRSMTTLDGVTTFEVHISRQLAVDEDGSLPSLAEIREACSTILYLSALVLMDSYSQIQVSYIADFFGLVYKNVLHQSPGIRSAIADGTLGKSNMQDLWNEVYVHPLLGNS